MQTKRPLVVVDEAIPFLNGVLDPWCDVRALPGAAVAAADLRDADALVVRTRTRCDAALLGGSSVRLVVTATIGFDHIDCAWCAAHGIEVATAAGCNARGVLQWVAGVLALDARRRGWRPAEKCLGIVGVGHVGELVRQYAEAWGFRTVCCDPPREAREHSGFCSLEAVAEAADVLTLHTPLDATTRHLVDARLVARMKRDALLVNASRGGVVATEAVLDSPLRFAFDVWEGEPAIDPRALERAEAATPHIAGYSVQGKANATAAAVRAIARRFGLPLGAWYPPEALRPVPRPIGWEEMCATIDRYFDVEAETQALKRAPEAFERMRDAYRYRAEYF